MNVEKKYRYPDLMTLNGMHTFSGYLNQEITYISPEVKPAIKSCSRNKVRNKDEYETYVQINPNKLHGKQKLIKKHSEFLDAMEKILEGLGADPDEFRISRADFCFNSIDQNCYEDYKKLHRLVICCLAEAYKYKNCYMSHNLWTYKSLSVAIKNDENEAENYDKAEESNNTDESKNRFEIRALKMQGSTLEHEFLDKWCHRLDKAITYFEAVQQHYNMELERLYKEDLAKDKKDRDYTNLNGFLLRYKECIFSRKQMIDLLSRFDEVKNPETKANNFKRAHRIEYFSSADLKFVVDCLKEKMQEYFNS